MGGQDGSDSCVARGLFITVHMGKTLTCVYRTLMYKGSLLQVVEPDWQCLSSHHESGCKQLSSGMSNNRNDSLIPYSESRGDDTRGVDTRGVEKKAG